MTYKTAGITVKDVDFAQVYEPHVTSLVPMVAATQIVPDRNKIIDFILDGGTSYEGRLPTGTDGGRGFLGMTSGSNVGDGVYETVLQMRGLAGKRQLKKLTWAWFWACKVKWLHPHVLFYVTADNSKYLKEVI